MARPKPEAAADLPAVVPAQEEAAAPAAQPKGRVLGLDQEGPSPKATRQAIAAEQGAANAKAAVGHSMRDFFQLPHSLQRPKGAGPPLFATPKVNCYACGSEVEENQARITSKQKNTWRCKFCRVKITELYRCTGSWPPAEFAEASQDQIPKHTIP